MNSGKKEKPYCTKSIDLSFLYLESENPENFGVTKGKIKLEV